jgi:hypothetical protein
MVYNNIMSLKLVCIDFEYEQKRKDFWKEEAKKRAKGSKKK